ncbi:heme lyase CcmF/NrfE family subunit [Hyphomonas sp.]|uniref:heme lyase CcmF/NrfE family subunit n=1 Tax=Hyphomonas sp. TaxID=87 RepID=UPI003527FAC4
MIGEIGLFCLILALTAAVVQSTVPMWGAYARNSRMMSVGDSAAVVQFLLLAVAFGCLIAAFASSDFSLRIVAANSHTLKPLFYKVTAAWGQHEGSMLLWVLVLAAFGGAVAVFGTNLPATLKARTLAIQGMIGVAFLAFIIFTSNPFARLFPAPFEGNGFNPLLQDPGLAFHPPMLYFGYVGFSIAYSFSVAALIEGRVDAAWARWVRPWVLASWCFLTVGITAGSLWAYYELGWGGWWFWDPVENASFMPWLIGTALLHSALVVERRHALVNWTLLLSILTFTLSLIGTFLVRSGVLTSVHAFAVDPARGVFILGMILLASGGALTLYALRASVVKQGPPFAGVSREGGILANNLLLLCATAVVFLGTFYPLLIDTLTHDKITVGPPYFNMTFAPLMILVAMIMTFGPFVRWRSDSAKAATTSIRRPAIAAALLGLVIGTAGKSVVAGLGFGFASLVIFGLIAWVIKRTRLGLVPLSQSLYLARAFPRATWGFLGAHLGFALVMIGVAGTTSWNSETVSVMRPGDTLSLSGYELTLSSNTITRGPNYEAEQLTFNVALNGHPDGVIETERRYYPERDTFTTEAGIRPGPLANLYVAYSQSESGEGYTVRFNRHPFVIWIWIGGFVIAGGGFVSLTDRRFRVAAPHKTVRSARRAHAEGV